MKQAIILMADQGHDPTETVAAYDELKRAAFTVHFATATGAVPQCDSRMLRGWTQKLLGATSAIVKSHEAMVATQEYSKPLPWEANGFDLNRYDIVWLPGGHEKGVRQIIESASVHRLLASYMDLCKKSASDGEGTAKRCLAAICHGVMVLSEGRHPETGKSLLYEAKATALPGLFEGGIYHATRLVLGDYYKTFGGGSENVETAVRKAMKDDKVQWTSSVLPIP